MNDEIKSLIQNFTTELNRLLVKSKTGSSDDSKNRDDSVYHMRDKLRKEGFLTGNRHCEVCDQWY